jgi:hypothetical protein
VSLIAVATPPNGDIGAKYQYDGKIMIQKIRILSNLLLPQM